jgi:hypothetical protein
VNSEINAVEHLFAAVGEAEVVDVDYRRCHGIFY